MSFPNFEYKLSSNYQFDNMDDQSFNSNLFPITNSQQEYRRELPQNQKLVLTKDISLTEFESLNTVSLESVKLPIENGVLTLNNLKKSLLARSWDLNICYVQLKINSNFKDLTTDEQVVSLEELSSLDCLELRLYYNQHNISKFYQGLSSRHNSDNQIQNGDDSESEEGEMDSENNWSQRQKRVKERKIFEVLNILQKWKNLLEIHNSNRKNKKIRKLSTDKAAQQLGISRKSLDDYKLQINRAERKGFEFKLNMYEGFGVIRKFNKTQPDLQVQQQLPSIYNQIPQQQQQQQLQISASQEIDSASQFQNFQNNQQSEAQQLFINLNLMNDGLNSNQNEQSQSAADDFSSNQVSTNLQSNFQISSILDSYEIQSNCPDFQNFNVNNDEDDLNLFGKIDFFQFDNENSNKFY